MYVCMYICIYIYIYYSELRTGSRRRGGQRRPPPPAAPPWRLAKQHRFQVVVTPCYASLIVTELATRELAKYCGFRFQTLKEESSTSKYKSAIFASSLVVYFNVETKTRCPAMAPRRLDSESCECLAFDMLYNNKNNMNKTKKTESSESCAFLLSCLDTSRFARVILAQGP